MNSNNIDLEEYSVFLNQHFKENKDIFSG